MFRFIINILLGFIVLIDGDIVRGDFFGIINLKEVGFIGVILFVEIKYLWIRK